VAGLKRAAPWIVTAVALGVAAVLLVPRGSAAGHHPDPRPDSQALAMTIRPATDFSSNPDAAEVYDIARQIPQALDGLYCHCHCKESMRHRSLLTCFQSEHASQCDICMGEARLAFQMLQQGRTLDEIRAAVDKQYGS
jgi:hypothetical protein